MMPNDKNPGASPIRRLLELDRAVHEPARLAILVLLSVVEKADFLYLLNETGLSKGNLSSHTAKLEEAGFIAIEKVFVEKTPRTVYQITPEGRSAFEAYRQSITEAIRPI
jgi:DNA-binding MarR family transcriptional regulator